MQTPDIDLSPRLHEMLALFEDLSPEERTTLLASLPIHGSPDPVMPDLDLLRAPKLRRIRDLPLIDMLADVFASPEFLTAFQPGIDIHNYSATCPGLQRLSGMLDEPIAKIGLCGLGSLEQRIVALGRGGYGGMRRDGFRYVTDPGFDRYEHQCRLRVRPQPPGCPVRNGSYGLILTLPRGRTLRQFALRYDLAMRPFGLRFYADSLEGRASCGAGDVRPDDLIRYYPYKGSQLRTAEEFMVTSPFSEGGQLATVAAVVLLGMVDPDLVPLALRDLVPPVGRETLPQAIH